MRKVIFVLIWIFCTCISTLSSASEILYSGIDVSNWQGYIDYTSVKNDGIQVVYIKATEGSNIVDPYFQTNYTNSKSAGLKIGFYHFLTATNEEEAILQANFFASVISGLEPDCRLAMDFEVFNNLSKDQINSISFAFLDRLSELTKKEVVIYSDAYNAINTFSSSLAEKYPLWLAEYESQTIQTGNWTDWIGLQYTDQGRINGIDGFSVDRDNFKSEIFLTSTEPVNTDNFFNDQIITYTVQPGNTLSQIALQYDTTVASIAGLNNIKNPNLIFVNQILKIDTSRSLDDLSNDEGETRHIIYTVKSGDTLTFISKKYGVTIQSIVELNDIVNPNLIYIGEKLRINSLTGNQNNSQTQ